MACAYITPPTPRCAPLAPHAQRCAVLITRPQEGAHSFANAYAQYQRQQGAHNGIPLLPIIVAPLLTIVPIPLTAQQNDMLRTALAGGTLFLSSANAVHSITLRPIESPRPMIYCVGRETQHALQKRAWQASNTHRTMAFACARALLDAVANNVHRLPQPRLYIRGLHVHTDLAQELNRNAHCVDSITTYKQVTCALTKPTLRALWSYQTLIVPFFSISSAQVFLEAWSAMHKSAPAQQTPIPNIHAVCLSAAIANVIDYAQCASSIHIAKTPTRLDILDAMWDTISELYRSNSALRTIRV